MNYTKDKLPWKTTFDGTWLISIVSNPIKVVVVVFVQKNFRSKKFLFRKIQVQKNFGPRKIQVRGN